MKAIALFFLFIGKVLIIKSYYENKYSHIDKPKTIIKYILLINITELKVIISILGTLIQLWY